MTGDGWGDGPPADVVEQGGGRRFPSLKWRPPRGGVLLAVGLVAGLVIGAAAGYAAGTRQGSTVVSMPTAGPSQVSPVLGPLATGTALPSAAGPALSQDTGTCSVQSGRELQLGVQVTNGSAAPVGLGVVRAYFPLGGLRPTSEQWAPCGARGDVQAPALLGPGDSTWFSVTFQVLVKCPGPLPVLFTVDYTSAGKSAAVNLPGFPDLSQVPYSGCPS